MVLLIDMKKLLPASPKIDEHLIAAEIKILY